MEWIYVGVILNSILTGSFPTEEACLGHKAMLEKQKISGTCINSPSAWTATTQIGSGSILTGPLFCSSNSVGAVPCTR